MYNVQSSKITENYVLKIIFWTPSKSQKSFVERRGWEDHRPSVRCRPAASLSCDWSTGPADPGHSIKVGRTLDGASVPLNNSADKQASVSFKTIQPKPASVAPARTTLGRADVMYRTVL